MNLCTGGLGGCCIQRSGLDPGEIESYLLHTRTTGASLAEQPYSARTLDDRATVNELEPAFLVYTELKDFVSGGRKLKFEFLDRQTMFDGHFS